MPRHVGICTKYVATGLNDGHGGSLSITVVVEYRCSRAVSLGMPTTHKPTTLWTQEDWVQKGNQLLRVIFAIEVAKNDRWKEAAWVRENSKVRLKHFEWKEKAGAILDKLENHGKKVKRAHGQLAYQAGPSSVFCGRKRLGAFLLQCRWDASPLQNYPPVLSLLVLLYTPAWKEALWE